MPDTWLPYKLMEHTAQIRARKGRLGIMVMENGKSPPFSEQQFYRNLCKIGEKNGLHVFVFSPGRIHWTTGTVTGYSYNRRFKRWIKEHCPLPDLIYDRCFFNDKKAYLSYCAQIRQLRRHHRIKFLGHGLKGKWHVTGLLSKDTKTAPYVPPTELVTGGATIERWLADYGELFLKPQGGSQGRCSMYIGVLSNSEHRYFVKGRNNANRLFQYGFFEFEHLYLWLRRFMGRRRYVVQRYLELSTEDGEPFDIRSFVQKNGNGRWQLIGMALRRGKPGSLTSNLHGGGLAEQAEPFVNRHYGDQAAEILENIRLISMQIATTLERLHGRLLELGIDFGIDKSGQLWVLEVNSRPGRTIFNHIRDKPARKSAVRNPIYYACYLWDRHLGG